jgi:transposase
VLRSSIMMYIGMTGDVGRGGVMPKLKFARAPQDHEEEHRIRKLARSRHAPGHWQLRSRIIIASWQGRRTTAIAAYLGCHPQTVRKYITRFNKQGIEGLGDRPGAGRKPRLTQEERSKIIALVGMPPPGKLVRQGDTLEARDPEEEPHWTLDALTAAARGQGISVGRSQVRRILRAEGVRWRGVRSWAQSTDPDFVPKGRRSSPSTPSRPMERRSFV